MRIYIESTIPSYLVARPSRVQFLSACQQVTKDWWKWKRAEHDLFVSLLVLDEVAGGERKMAQLRLELMSELAILQMTPEAEALAQRILKSGLLPASADGDATHIALAAVHRMDVLLTWNCRHIANPAIQMRLRHLAEDLNCTLPTLCTPANLIGDFQ